MLSVRQVLCFQLWREPQSPHLEGSHPSSVAKVSLARRTRTGYQVTRPVKKRIATCVRHSSVGFSTKESLSFVFNIPSKEIFIYVVLILCTLVI